MKHRIVHGTVIDIPSLEEIAELSTIREADRPDRGIRVRQEAIIQLNAQGGTQGTPLAVYECPIGAEFEARRAWIDLGNPDTNTGQVSLNQAGVRISWLRSGAFIEYANPTQPAAGGWVPGLQVWGAGTGPWIRNGEVLQLDAIGLTPNAYLRCIMEGQMNPPEMKGYVDR